MRLTRKKKLQIALEERGIKFSARATADELQDLLASASLPEGMQEPQPRETEPEPPAPVEPEVSLRMLSDALTKYASRGADERADAIDMLRSYGIQKLGELETDLIPEAYAKLKEMAGGAL
jgi:hypothetical protein